MIGSPEYSGTIPRLLADAAARDPDGVWLRTDETTLTFGEAAARAAGVARALRDAGIRRGDLVMVTARSTPGYLLCWLALPTLGAVTVSVNPRSAPAEIAGMARQVSPRALISDAYSNEDVWVQERMSPTDHALVLRPETTPSTYAYMRHVLASHARVRPPLCVWQAGKSFRREQEQPTKHMRLKEFWQQEFQCLYTADTFNDYQEAALEPVRRMIAAMVGLPTRIVESDRLPSYSLRTADVEVDNGDKWMEVCSISKRTDFGPVAVPTKRGVEERETLVLEIAVGLDRCVYNWGVVNPE